MVPLRQTNSVILNHCYSKFLPYLTPQITKRSISETTQTKEKIDNKKLYRDVVPKIGLEVHAQLRLQSKLFSRGCSSSQAVPNSQLDLLDIALPGSLPQLNHHAIRAAVLTSLGLNCCVQTETHFDRKNYFYTDMPAGFQITQYNKPIAKKGFIDFIVKTYHNSVIAHSQQYDLVKYLYHEDRNLLEDFEPYVRRSYIKQIQLEQDSAKTLNQDDLAEDSFSLIDYNRSGVALIEIVFEPDLTNHHEASSLVKELINILETLKTCDCRLQEGSLRVDANVSILSIDGQELDQSRRVELKNLNSLKSLNRGIFYEINRQAALIKSGKPVVQETRTFDTGKNETIPLRLKEEAVDYRYVPEPNIPTIDIDTNMLEQIRKEESALQKLPDKIRISLMTDFKLDLALVAELMDEPGLCDYFRMIMSGRPEYNPNVIADFLIYTFSNLKDVSSLNDSLVKVDLTNNEFLKRLNPDKVQTTLDMMLNEKISFTTAFEVIKTLYTSNDTIEPENLVAELDWYQINDPSLVDELVVDLIKGMKNVSKRYKRDGEKKHLRRMIDKLCELTDNKVSVKGAITSINKKLRST